MTTQTPAQTTYKVKVNARGQMTLPIELRRVLGLEKDDVVVLQLDDGKISLETQQQVHARLMGKYAYIKESLAEELHLERRTEAKNR